MGIKFSPEQLNLLPVNGIPSDLNTIKDVAEDTNKENGPETVGQEIDNEDVNTWIETDQLDLQEN